MTYNGNPDQDVRRLMGQWTSHVHPVAEMQLQQRRQTLEAYKRRHMTQGVHEAMQTLGITEEEYDKRLMDYLFPWPIIYTASGTEW